MVELWRGENVDISSILEKNKAALQCTACCCFGCSTKRSHARPPMNRLHSSFLYTSKLINPPLHKAPSYASAPEAFSSRTISTKVAYFVELGARRRSRTNSSGKTSVIPFTNLAVIVSLFVVFRFRYVTPFVTVCHF